MSDTEILKQRRPEIAEFIEHWRSKYQKNFDFSDSKEQANFYEAMVELGRHLASTASSASLNVVVSNDGLCHVDVNSTPEAAPPIQD